MPQLFWVTHLAQAGYFTLVSGVLALGLIGVVTLPARRSTGAVINTRRNVLAYTKEVRDDRAYRYIEVYHE